MSKQDKTPYVTGIIPPVVTKDEVIIPLQKDSKTDSPPAQEPELSTDGTDSNEVLPLCRAVLVWGFKLQHWK